MENLKVRFLFGNHNASLFGDDSAMLLGKYYPKTEVLLTTLAAS